VTVVIALGDRFVFLQFLDRLGALFLGDAELLAQLMDRRIEVVAPLHRSFCEGRIGEMLSVVDAAALLLGDDLVVELLRHALELGDHRFDLGDLATLLVDLESLQPDETFTRLHGKTRSLGCAPTP
jgi:hypothetical protein